MAAAAWKPGLLAGLFGCLVLPLPAAAHSAKAHIVNLHLGTQHSAPSPAPNPGSSGRVDQILENTCDIMRRFADHYFHNGDYAQNVRLAHLVEQMDPGDVELYSDAAWLEWSSGDTAGAISELKRGIDANPRDPDAYSNMGQCYWIWLKKPDAAYEYYLEASRSFETTPWTVFTALGHCAEKVGDYTRAEIAWRTAILKAGPNQVQAGTARLNLDRLEKQLNALRDGEPIARSSG